MAMACPALWAFLLVGWVWLHTTCQSAHISPPTGAGTAVTLTGSDVVTGGIDNGGADENFPATTTTTSNSTRTATNAAATNISATNATTTTTNTATITNTTASATITTATISTTTAITTADSTTAMTTGDFSSERVTGNTTNSALNLDLSVDTTTITTHGKTADGRTAAVSAATDNDDVFAVHANDVSSESVTNVTTTTTTTDRDIIEDVDGSDNTVTARAVAGGLDATAPVDLSATTGGDRVEAVTHVVEGFPTDAAIRAIGVDGVSSSVHVVGDGNGKGSEQEVEDLLKTRVEEGKGNNENDHVYRRKQVKVYGNFYDEFYGIGEDDSMEEMQTERFGSQNTNDKIYDRKYDYSFHDTFYGLEMGGQSGGMSKRAGNDVENDEINKMWRDTVDDMIQELTNFLDNNAPCVVMRQRLAAGDAMLGLENGTKAAVGGGKGGHGEVVEPSSKEVWGLSGQALEMMTSSIGRVFGRCGSSCGQDGGGKARGADKDGEDNDHDADDISNGTTNDEMRLSQLNDSSKNSDGHANTNGDVPLTEATVETPTHKTPSQHQRESLDEQSDYPCRLPSSQTPTRRPSQETHGMDNLASKPDPPQPHQQHHHHNQEHHEHQHHDVHHHYHNYYNQPPPGHKEIRDSKEKGCKKLCENNQESDVREGKNRNNNNNNNDNNNNNYSGPQHDAHRGGPRGHDLSNPEGDEGLPCYDLQAAPSQCVDIASQESVVSQLCTKMTSIENGNRCMKAQLAADRKRALGEVSKLEVEITNLKRIVELLQRSAMFYAEAPFGSSKVTGYRVKVLQGGGFEPTSGLFRAPYKGVYQITVGYFRREASNVDDQINVLLDDQVLYRLQVDGSEDQRMFMTSLNMDQSVYLKTSVDYQNVVGDGININVVHFGVVLMK